MRIKSLLLLFNGLFQPPNTSRMDDLPFSEVKIVGERTAQFEPTHDAVTGNLIPTHKSHLHHTRAVVFGMSPAGLYP